MIKVLHFYPIFNNAGTEQVVVNIMRNINKDQILFDFCASKKGVLDCTFEQMGGKFYYIDLSDENAVFDFLKQHPQYQIIHVHTCAEMGTIVRAAKRAGVKHRIIHSHISRRDLPAIYSLGKVLKTWKALLYSNHKIACSVDAAKWQYSIFWKRAEMWQNNVSHSVYKFDSNTRAKIRNQLGIPNTAKVICHIGRFTRQKNHPFLIDILNKIMSSDNNIYALLIGEGEDFENIKAQAKNDRIMFLKNSVASKDVYSASDMLLFPSLYEGLPLVPLEAQMNGLSCLLSDQIVKGTDLEIGLVEFLSLETGLDTWCERTNKTLNAADVNNRSDTSTLAGTTPGNTENTIHKIEKFYLSLK